MNNFSNNILAKFQAFTYQLKQLQKSWEECYSSFINISDKELVSNDNKSHKTTQFLKPTDGISLCLSKQGPLAAEKIITLSADKKSLINIPIVSNEAFDILLLLCYHTLIHSKSPKRTKNWVNLQELSKDYYNTDEKDDAIYSIITSKLRPAIKESCSSNQFSNIDINRYISITRKEKKIAICSYCCLSFDIIKIDKSVTDYYICASPRKRKGIDINIDNLAEHRKNVFLKYWNWYKKYHV